MFVINSKGHKEKFSFNKVKKSAKRAGASNHLANDIARTIQQEVRSNMKTSEIYTRISQMLRKKDSCSALRFSLKQAIKRLGPTGFPFEKYVAEILKHNGFQIKINQIVSGRCIKDYEIDFIARKGDLTYIGECKYRNRAGDRITSKDALINQARFEDIRQRMKGDVRAMLVTNTKFTTRARKYAECMNMELLGWRYPNDQGLEYLIEKDKLYPITILPCLKSPLKDLLVSRNIMIIKDIVDLDPKRFRLSLDSIKRDAQILYNQEN